MSRHDKPVGRLPIARLRAGTWDELVRPLEGSFKVRPGRDLHRRVALYAKAGA